MLIHSILQPGQAVYGTADMALSGAYAEYALSYADAIAPMPKTLDYIHAASVPIVAMTAWQARFASRSPILIQAFINF